MANVPDQLQVRDLVVQSGQVRILDGVDLCVVAGTVVALLGASGAGKTMTGRACIGMVTAKPGVTEGTLEISVEGSCHRPYQQDTPAGIESSFQDLRGRVIGLLPQAARASLDPLWTIGRQVREVEELGGSDLGAGHWLRLAGFPNPDEVCGLYPHELSGGMAQRACIAIALARGSRFLIADELTTGMDPTVEQEVLAQLRTLADGGHGVLLITHDLRLVPQWADEVVILDQGRVVEALPAANLFDAVSPAARTLVDAALRIQRGRA